MKLKCGNDGKNRIRVETNDKGEKDISFVLAGDQVEG